MKISELGPYYVWADKRIIKLLSAISEEQFNQKLESIGLSLRDLSIHMASYYELWLHHMETTDTMPSYRAIIAELTNESKTDLLDHWKRAVEKFSLQVKECVGKIDIPVNQDQSVEMDFDDVILAYTDHSTYHRGQLIIAYKIVSGGEDAVNTDYWTYLLEEKYHK